jgi:SAM-dependent MidA family methyltransferase
MTDQPAPLANLIFDLIHRRGPITFHDFMDHCLYHPALGYYARGIARTGARGDYFTSPDVHPVFARLVARQAMEMWELLGHPEIFKFVEAGIGNGNFAIDFLDAVNRLDRHLWRALEYYPLEASPEPANRLHERAAGRGLDAPLRAAASMDAISAGEGCVFSNELLDALPVSVLAWHQEAWQEVYVDLDGGQFVERLGEIADPWVKATVSRMDADFDEGWRIEVNRHVASHFESAAKILQRGFVITIDYGGLGSDLRSPARPRGTLMAYHQHRAAENVYALLGEQDLTAHVDFTACIQAGREAGLGTTGFTTQERFLMALGEADEFEVLFWDDETETQKQNSRLKLKGLINPAGMGTIFKVLIQHRGLNAPRLTGLRYARELPTL